LPRTAAAALTRPVNVLADSRSAAQPPPRPAGQHRDKGGGGGGGGGGQAVDVGAVAVNPASASNQGDTIDVAVALTGPAPGGGVNLISAIFFDTGGGNYQMAQPPGFSLPPQPIAVPAGDSQVQFQMVRDSDPLPAGSYVIAVARDGAQYTTGGFFTVT